MKNTKILYLFLVLSLCVAFTLKAQEATTQSQENNQVCVQVITPAKNLQTGECKEFSTPCDVPQGWQRVEKCPPEVSPIVNDVVEKYQRQELSIKENIGQVICKALGTCPNQKGQTEVTMKSAIVKNISDNQLEVSIFNLTYTIDLTSAKLLRNNWGKSNLEEFSIGDLVNVWGYLDNSNYTIIHAKNVRNVSLQATLGVFKGTIKSIDETSSSFVLATQERGDQTVIVSQDTKIVNGTSTGAFSDLKEKQNVVVRGTWNKTLSKIYAKSVIIGFENDPRRFLREGLKIMQKESEEVKGTVKELRERIQNQIEETRKRINELLEQLNRFRGTSTLESATSTSQSTSSNQ
jgi:hypothetical protein